MSIATCIIVLKKSKADNNVLFIDASAEFIKDGNKNRLIDENIERIIQYYNDRRDIAYKSRLVNNKDLIDNACILSVSSYVEQEDTREIVDISDVNTSLDCLIAEGNQLNEKISASTIHIEQLLNQEWNEKIKKISLGELGSYFGGLTGKTKGDFVNGNAKFITYMNVFSNPSLDVSATGVVNIREGEKQNKVQKGDILFTGSSETPEEAGMSCVVTEELSDDYYLNSFCFGIRIKQPELFDLNYLKHILRSYSVRKEISKSASGVTRFNISKSRLSKVQIPIPSLSEQHRIVSILDNYEESIANLKEQLAQRDKQYEYYRNKLLTFE